MRFGVAVLNAYEGLGYPVGMVPDPSVLVRLGRTAERLGFDRVWANDHPVTPSFLRDERPHHYDALATLSAVAGATRRIGLGTAVIALPLRDPVELAHQASSLDQLSGGRLVLGLGLGAYREEFVALRPDRAKERRGALFDEAIGQLRAQRPRIPLYVGGHGVDAIKRAARVGDGWIPGWQPFDVLAERIALLRRELERNGRDAGAVQIAVELSARIAARHEDAVRAYEGSRFVRHRRSRDTTGRDQSRMTASNLVGSPDTIKEKIARLESLGVDECAALAFPAESIDELEEQWTRFAAELLPRIASAT